MESFRIRRGERRDDEAISKLIRTVMPEFGADAPGFAIHDPELDAMFDAYAEDRAGFFVLERDGEVVGGAGYGPLAGGAGDVCELRKMYLYQDARGHGMGKKLLHHVLEAARADGYATCYLETLAGMGRAAELYRSCGFEPLDAPMGATGHFGCDRWMAKPL